jgi:hypothetical protein
MPAVRPSGRTRALQTLWSEWLATGERLLRTLHEQTAAVTLRDVARVERIQPELEALLAQARQIDDQAVASAKGLAAELGVEPSLRSLVAALDKAEAQQIQALANRVTITARHIEEVMAKNRALIDNELTYVTGTLTLIAKTANESNGAFAEPTRAVVLDRAA